VKAGLLDYLVCLLCGGRLICHADSTRADEVLEGTLECAGCRARFPIRRGVPRMVPERLAAPEQASSRAFGTQWRMLARLLPGFLTEFRSYLEPLDAADIRGRAVLDAGCGMGKFSLAAAVCGARIVIGVDLSESVDVAYEHLRDVPNAHVVQASLYQLPLRSQAFDFVFSIGVLHHTPDPEKAFRGLVDVTAEEGRLFVWLYALEGNEVFVRWIDPLRARVFSRLPSWSNRVVATILAVPFWVMIRAMYVPLGRWGRGSGLPYHEYFLYFSRLGFRTFWGTVYDKLVPPISFYLTRDEIERWLVSANLTALALRHRNGNSWSCLARRNRPA